jgi:hypothetical protein
MNKPNTEALDFIVINTRTGNACAAFMLPRDALQYIFWRRTNEGPHGPSYEIVNADGSMISAQLQSHVDARNAIGAQEHTRLVPNWGGALAA